MNVLMLVVDSLRRDYCYGSSTETPTIDNLREEGVSFDQAISSATWTPPCMGSIFSGVYPHRLGMYDFSTPYPEDLDSLFSYFGRSGYDVGSFVFDEQYLFKEVPEANVLGNFRDYSQPKDWIRERDDDFFLFVHHYWVHGPYEPQDSAEAWSKANERIRRELRENHEEAVEKYRHKYVDAVERMSERWLAGLLETLESEGILDETLIIFLGDHGESWGERYEDKNQIQKNFHLHGKLLYDELIRVPLIMRYPEKIPRDEIVSEQVRQVDLFPTIVELADLDITDDTDRDGESLLPFVQHETSHTLPAISSATDAELKMIDKMSIRYPDEKLIWTVSSDEIELYDLDSDPEELHDVSDSRPERVEELKGRLEEELDRASNDREPTERVRQHLKDLGYL